MIIHTYDENYLNEGWAVVAFNQPHRVDEVVAIKQWCYDTFGLPGERWRDSIAYGEVRFEDKKDLMLFVMRWS